MTMGPDPQLNAVGDRGKHYPPLVKYLGGDRRRRRPGDGRSRRRSRSPASKDPARPVQVVDSFSLWGVEPRITELEPSPVFLSPSGHRHAESAVTHEIEPPEYRSLLAPNDLQFEVRADGRTTGWSWPPTARGAELHDPRGPLAAAGGDTTAA